MQSVKKCNALKIEEIRNISIESYLRIKGIEPNRDKGNSLYYAAVWRDGDNPNNVHVDTERNVWYDYKDGVGGGIIELVMLIEKCSLPEALKLLSNRFANISIIQPRERKLVDKVKTIAVTKVGDIYSYPIKNYLTERGISLDIAKKYCSEINYTFDNVKIYYALGFQTMSKSWVLRSKYFKGCTGQDITYFDNKSKSVVVFEGFMDFLSFIQLYGKTEYNVIVLNSIVNTKRNEHFINIINSSDKVYLLLDNDADGEKTVKNLQLLYGDKIIDKSSLYKGYNDLNDYLKSKNE